jgi:uncharacterized protein (DUF736 family)
MIIGNFTFVDDGYSGLILAPGGVINAVRIAPVEGKGVDYTVTVDGAFDLGAAWKRHSRKTGKAYLSVKFDSPFLAAPVNCALIANDDGEDGGHILVWSRRARTEAKDDTAA